MLCSLHISAGKRAVLRGHVPASIVKKGDYAALLCGSMQLSAAECLHSSAVCAAQLVHAADESICCHEGWRCGLFLNHFGQ